MQKIGFDKLIDDRRPAPRPGCRSRRRCAGPSPSCKDAAHRSGSGSPSRSPSSRPRNIGRPFASRSTQLALVKFGAQHLHGGRAVHVLRALVRQATRTCRKMRDPYGGVGSIYVLAAFAAGAVSVDPQIALMTTSMVSSSSEERTHSQMRCDDARWRRRAKCAPAGARRSRLSANRRRSRRLPESNGLHPCFLARLVVVDSSGIPSRSQQRRYIRSSMSAQSWDSVPPAPG